MKGNFFYGVMVGAGVVLGLVMIFIMQASII